MAFSGYSIDPAVARGVVNSARNRFDDLHGMENTLETTGEAVAVAADEDEINTALQESFTNFLRPFVVTMITSATSIFTATDDVINIYDNADTTMADDSDAQEQAVDDMAAKAKTYDNVADYSDTVSTADDGQGPAANENGHDW